MTDLEIIHALKPGWGRCVRACVRCDGDGHTDARDCPDCNGTGEVFREWLVCSDCEGDRFFPAVRHREPGVVGGNLPCRKCEGEGRIPDKAGRELIAEAADAWWKTNAAGGEWPERNSWIAAHHSWGWHLWYLRKGKCWQADIESHVRNYQQQPPDLLTVEGCEFLKGVLREVMRVSYHQTRNGWMYSVKYHPKTREFVAAIWKGDSQFHRVFVETSDTEPAALRAAAVAACEEGKNQ